VKPSRENTKQQRNAENKIDFGAIDVGEAGNDFGMENTEGKRWNRKHKTYERAGSADVEESAGSSNRRANQNERAKRADERGKWNEEGISGADVMMAAGKKVAQLMREKNGEQGKGKRNACGEARRVLVEKREGVDKFVIRSRLIICVSDRELSTGDQAGAKSKQKQDACKDERSCGRAAGNRGVLEFVNRHGAPIDVDWDGWRKVFWGWRGHEKFRTTNSVRKEQYNTVVAFRTSSHVFDGLSNGNTRFSTDIIRSL
jgi:hypothetical protein